MKHILIVEDSPPTGTMIKKRLEKTGKYTVTWLTSMQETEKLLATEGNESFFAALLDFNLPDATKGEIIPLVVSKNIPVIVFTALVSEEVRQKVWSHQVVDYVLKEDVLSLEYILSLLDRLKKNAETQILVSDRDAEKREKIAGLLRVHRYDVLTADSGRETLKILAANPKIRLVIAASEVTDMDGLTLIQKILRNYGKEDLAIMGMVYAGDHITAARFLKYGANHCIVRQSFLPEEFYCMVRLLIENIEHIQQLRSTSLVDFLTGLHNRRYFFITGEKLFASARRQTITLVCAMLDLDFFKKVNDQYGHEAGDRVLQHVANILRNRLRKTDIVARIGGEEFCILAVNMDTASVHRIFDELRRQIERSVVVLEDGMGEVKITVSIGITTHLGNSLDQMLKKSDFLLYEAKEGGRNMIVSDL
ncbi:MAG: diguanylate cyclase [Proteobacteria bacterium]|nr:diguanylate cyclase [Pseudomonadota bacterium]MBU4297983.1 diguanylate cyclase [Pseudomonadota bacterium]MCG2749543.1 diguanylate cyclase [Desulfobulbaceae bacterium]